MPSQIYVNTDSNHFSLHSLQWDSEFFETPSYRLEVCSEPGSESSDLKEFLSKECFISAKLDTFEQACESEALMSLGFQYVGTQVVLEKGLQKEQIEEGDTFQNPAMTSHAVRVEKVISLENLPLKELGGVYTRTRFHMDPAISKAKADDLWVEYLRNFKFGSDRDLYVAKIGDDVAGCIATLDQDNLTYLFLVSILPGFQGRGVGQALVLEIVKDNPGKTLRTGTQICNVAALNFYMKCGFKKVVGTQNMLHYWNSNQGESK